MTMKTIPTTQITITDSYVSRAQENLVNYLLSLQADKFLYEVYKVAGLEPLTDSGYQGWERSDKINFRGHFFGHFMSACALAYQSVADAGTKAALAEKMQVAVNGLASAQAAYAQAHPESAGYISAFRESALDEVEGLPVAPADKENCLVPWYNLHKVLVGLMDIAEYLAVKDPETSQLALQTVSQFGDYIYRRMMKLADKNQMLKIEYGGMNDGLYRLFELTGKKEHAIAATYFDETSLFEQLAAGQDVLPGKHANTTIPKLIGALKRYRVYQNKEAQQTLSSAEFAQLSTYLKAAENFWEIVINDHTYCTGGNSQSEHFHEPHELYHDAAVANGDCTCETCNTHNMLKLSRSLYEVTGDPKYLDYYERTYINAILASQNPETGMMMYFQPMGAGYNKVYNRPYDEFWCCTGTGVESFAKLADTYYYQEGDTLYPILYFSNEVVLPQYNAKLIQKTDRKTGVSQFRLVAIDEAKPVTPIRLALRLPAWAKDWSLLQNGESLASTVESGFIHPATALASDSEIQLNLTMTVKVTPTADNPRYIAFEYGPYVLAAHLGKVAVNEDNPNGILVRVGTKEALLPDSLTVKDEAWLSQAAEKLQPIALPEKLVAFQLMDTQEKLVFSPYYEIHGERYGLYFEVQAADSEAAQQTLRRQKEALRQQALVAAELHNFDDNNSEYAKNLAYEKSEVEASWGRRYRQALAGGWFSYGFPIPQGAPVKYLQLTLKTEEAGSQLQVVFNDDLATQQLVTVAADAATDFYQINLEVPANLQESTTIKVTFSGVAAKVSAHLYGIAILRGLTYGTENDLTDIHPQNGQLENWEEELIQIKSQTADESVLVSFTLADPTGLLVIDDILVDDSKPRLLTQGQHQVVVFAGDHVNRKVYHLEINESSES